MRFSESAFPSAARTSTVAPTIQTESSWPGVPLPAVALHFSEALTFTAPTVEVRIMVVVGVPNLILNLQVGNNSAFTRPGPALGTLLAVSRFVGGLFCVCIRPIAQLYTTSDSCCLHGIKASYGHIWLCPQYNIEDFCF